MKRLLLALAAGAVAGWIARELTSQVDLEDDYEIEDREMEPGVVIVSAPLPSEAIALEIVRKLTEDLGHEFRVGVCRMPEPATALSPAEGPVVWH